MPPIFSQGPRSPYDPLLAARRAVALAGCTSRTFDQGAVPLFPPCRVLSSPTFPDLSRSLTKSWFVQLFPSRACACSVCFSFPYQFFRRDSLVFSYSAALSFSLLRDFSVERTFFLSGTTALSCFLGPLASIIPQLFFEQLFFARAVLRAVSKRFPQATLTRFRQGFFAGFFLSPVFFFLQFGNAPILPRIHSVPSLGR